MKQEGVIAMDRILAVAIGKVDYYTKIDTPNPSGVRRYINGLIDFLTNPKPGAYNINKSYTIGVDYYIDYYECDEEAEDFATWASGTTPAIIVCMSTPIVRYARDYVRPLDPKIPIVGIFSDAHGEGFDRVDYICGINASRINRGHNYYETFKANYSGLNDIYILCRHGNKASDGALADIKNHFTVNDNQVLDVRRRTDIPTLVSSVPSGSGLLVLPVDVFFADSGAIISSAVNNVPIFWSAGEFTYPTQYNTKLYYGASQSACGGVMGQQVQYIFYNKKMPSTQVLPVPPDY
jgi:hypothetical protein